MIKPERLPFVAFTYAIAVHANGCGVNMPRGVLPATWAGPLDRQSVRHVKTQARTFVKRGVSGQLAGAAHGVGWMAGGTQSAGIVAGVADDHRARVSVIPQPAESLW
jgi:hypothetical protein